MRIGRTLPPAASPIYPRDIINGIRGMLRGEKEVKRFENELKDFFGVKHCFLLSSGKAALTVILRALKGIHPERDEVLIPAFTCYSVPSAIVRAGLKIRLCDIDENTLDFNFDELRSQLTTYSSQSSSSIPQDRSSYEHSAMGHELYLKQSSLNSPSNPTNLSNRKSLLAVIPTHLFGLPANIAKLRKLVEDPDMTIIEDAAQAMGGEVKGRKLGTLGDVGFFSLGRGKAFSTVEGGIVLTNRADFAEAIQNQMADLDFYSILERTMLAAQALALAVFLHPRLFFIPKAMPFLQLGMTVFDPGFKMRKISSFQAGLARLWSLRLPEYREARARNTRHYVRYFNSIGGMPGHASSFEQEQEEFISPVRYPLKISDHTARERLLGVSESAGLGIMPTYPDSVNNIAELKDAWLGNDFRGAATTAHQLVTLPVHSLVAEGDGDRTLVCLRDVTNLSFWRRDLFLTTGMGPEEKSSQRKVQNA